MTPPPDAADAPDAADGAGEPEDQDVDLLALVGKAFDIVRYAPVGIVLDGPKMLPDLAEKGKVHVENARMLGDMALRRSRDRLSRQLGSAGAQAVDLLRLFGVLPAPDPDPEAEADAEESVAPATPTREVPSGNHRTAPSETDAGGGAEPADAPAVDELAIPGYDSLSASQVVIRLAGLSPEQLAAVRAYEAAHRGRKTILNKVAQLQP